MYDSGALPRTTDQINSKKVRKLVQPGINPGSPHLAPAVLGRRGSLFVVGIPPQYQNFNKLNSNYGKFIF